MCSFKLWCLNFCKTHILSTLQQWRKECCIIDRTFSCRMRGVYQMNRKFAFSIICFVLSCWWVAFVLNLSILLSTTKNNYETKSTGEGKWLKAKKDCENCHCFVSHVDEYLYVELHRIMRKQWWNPVKCVVLDMWQKVALLQNVAWSRR